MSRSCRSCADNLWQCLKCRSEGNHCHNTAGIPLQTHPGLTQPCQTSSACHDANHIKQWHLQINAEPRWRCPLAKMRWQVPASVAEVCEKTTKRDIRSHLDRCLHANRDLWLEHLGPKVAHDSHDSQHVLWYCQIMEWCDQVTTCKSRCLINVHQISLRHHYAHASVVLDTRIRQPETSEVRTPLTFKVVQDANHTGKANTILCEVFTDHWKKWRTSQTDLPNDTSSTVSSSHQAKRQKYVQPMLLQNKRPPEACSS